MFDLNNIPVTGGVVLGAVIWAASCTFVLGPIVAERTIAASGWGGKCVLALEADIAATIPSSPQVPDIGCEAVGSFLDELVGRRAVKELCSSRVGDAIDQSIDLALHKLDAPRVVALLNASRATERVPEACSCAASVVASDKASWGIAAGTLRLAGGPPDLAAELTRALRSPHCELKG